VRDKVLQAHPEQAVVADLVVKLGLARTAVDVRVSL
jgi:hypothetical protein